MQPAKDLTKTTIPLTDKEHAKCDKKLLVSSPASPSTEKRKGMKVAQRLEVVQYFCFFSPSAEASTVGGECDR